MRYHYVFFWYPYTFSECISFFPEYYRITYPLCFGEFRSDFQNEQVLEEIDIITAALTQEFEGLAGEQSFELKEIMWVGSGALMNCAIHILYLN